VCFFGFRVSFSFGLFAIYHPPSEQAPAGAKSNFTPSLVNISTLRDAAAGEKVESKINEKGC